MFVNLLTICFSYNTRLSDHEGTDPGDDTTHITETVELPGTSKRARRKRGKVCCHLSQNNLILTLMTNTKLDLIPSFDYLSGGKS